MTTSATTRPSHEIVLKAVAPGSRSLSGTSAAVRPADASTERQANRFWSLVLLALALGVHLLMWKTVNAGLEGDELRYLDQARSLLAGAPLYPNGEVRNPPLFPAFLAALLWMGLSVAGLKLASVIASTATALLLLSLLTRVWPVDRAFGLACLFVLYPPMVMLGSQLMTEPFASLILVSICWLLIGIRDLRRPGLARLVGLSLLLASLALLKPMFGYATAAACALSIVLFALRAWDLRGFHAWAASASLLAIVLCSPYLAYIHSLTGSGFSWGTTGGEHLYWMSIGGEDVWGSWVSPSEVDKHPFLVSNGYAREVATADAMRGPEAQRFYARLGAERVRENPLHLMRNIVANAGRVLFNYPFSFRPQSLYTYAYLLPNMVLYLCLALSFAALPFNRRGQHPGLLATLALGLIYLVGNMLAGSTGRQGIVLLGPILVWLAFQLRLLMDAGIVGPPRKG